MVAEINVKRLAEQLDEAQMLLDKIRITSGCEAFRGVNVDPAERIRRALNTAIKAHQQREIRPAFLGNDELFGEPAWDILLDLFIRQSKEEKVSVRAVSIKGERPATTALRWFLILEERGLIAKEPDPDDSSLAVLHFTATGYEAMLRYFEAITL